MIGTKRWPVIFIFFISVLINCTFAFGQGWGSIASDYIRTDFTIEEGLPNDTVDAIAQTENGLLWVGTESGLASFDGHTFTSIQLRIPGSAPPGSINSLVEGPDGDLWVGTDAGIVRIAKKDLNDPYLTASTAYRLGKEQSDEIEVLFKARDGVIWAGTNHGLYRFDGVRFVPELASVYVSRIKQANDGHLLLITGGGLVELDGNKVIEHHGLGATFGIHDNQIFDVFTDKDGTTWYGTQKGARRIGVRTFPPLLPSQPASTTTFNVNAGPDGTIWLSTGVGFYRVVGDQLQTPASGVSARSFFIGQDGDLWIGTNGKGLIHLQRRRAYVYTNADGLPQNDIAMTVLPTRDGKLWVGSNCGLSVLDGSRFRILDEKDGLANSCVWTLAEDRQRNLWIGSYGGGIFSYKDGRFTQYTVKQGLASAIVFQIIVARDDSLWIATPDGLSHMKNGRIRNYTTVDGLSSTHVLDIHQDRSGTIWVATGGGVDRLSNDRFLAVPRDAAADDTLAKRFVEDSMGHLYTTNSPRGISLIETDQITLIDSMLNLMDMVESADHNLWFSSKAGIIRIAAQDLFALKENHDAPLNYEVIDRADGLISTQAAVGSPNIAMSSDGKLWLATVKGLAMIEPSLLSRVSRKPKVFVAGVIIDGKNYAAGRELLVPRGPHHVELHIAAIDLATPQKIRLQYRMQGVDSRWLDVGSTRTAVYSNIPVGAHELYVRATDSNGNWDAGKVIYHVVQQPFFYQTKLFQAGTVVALLLLLGVIYLARVRYLIRQTQTILEERQVERESIARDLHDTFLQGIQGLILRFHTGTQQISPDQPVRKLFEEALQQSDGVMLEGRNVLSRLRTAKVTGEALPEALLAMGTELGSLSSAQYDVTVSGKSRDLHTVVQEELRKIGREAIFNAFRHSRAKKIEVELQFGTFEFQIRFRDDGIGIDPAVLNRGSAPGHYGLQGMRERVNVLGGHLELWSRPGAGTELEVRVPGAIAYRDMKERASFNWISRLIRGRAL